MAEYPKTVVLRDGAHLTLRPLESGDTIGGLALPHTPSDALLTIVAVDDDRAAALMVLERLNGDASAGVTLALDPAYRGRRLGTWMLLDAVHAASARGVDRLVAEAPEDARDYVAALRRLDFVEEATGASPGMVVLVKRLHRGWPDF